MPSRVRSLLKTFCACALVVLLAACARERPPTGTVRVETGDAVVNVAMLTHGYSWGGVANDPVAPSDLADDDVPDLDVARTLEARASFSQPAIEVEVTRCAEDGSLEDVACALEEGTATFDVEPGWRYCVGAWFEDGDASYLFDAKSDQGEEATMDEFTSTALVVAARDGQVLLVDQETETPYYPTLPEGAPAREDAERQFFAAERDRTLFACMRRLAPQYREVLELTYFEGFTPAECAVILKKSGKQVYNLLARAKTSLKTLLEKEGLDHEDV